MVLLLWLLIVIRFGQYLSPKDAGAAYPAIGERHFRRLIAERRIPFSKIGSKVLLDRDDIETLIRSTRVEPTPERLVGVASKRERRARVG